MTDRQTETIRNLNYRLAHRDITERVAIINDRLNLKLTTDDLRLIINPKP